MAVLSTDVTHDAAGAGRQQCDCASQHPSHSPLVLSLRSTADWIGHNTPRSTEKAQTIHILIQIWLTLLNSPLIEWVPWLQWKTMLLFFVFFLKWWELNLKCCKVIEQGWLLVYVLIPAGCSPSSCLTPCVQCSIRLITQVGDEREKTWQSPGFNVELIGC